MSLYKKNNTRDNGTMKKYADKKNHTLFGH